MQHQQQPFAAFVLETLMHRSTELAEQWSARTKSVAPELQEQVVRTLLSASANTADADGTRGDGASRHGPLIETGRAVGTTAYQQQNASLHLLLEELDLLAGTLFDAAARVAAEYPGVVANREGVLLARRLAESAGLLRRAAVKGYTQSVEEELRKRYRAIRHDLRNPLGTIRSAVSVLTDEGAPPEMRESPRVRAMVIRNARVLDQMIGSALGDAAACLPAFAEPRDESPPELADLPQAVVPPASGGQQRNDVAHARQRPDLESGAF